MRTLRPKSGLLHQQVPEPAVTTSHPFLFGAVGEAQATATSTAADTSRAIERRSVMESLRS